MSVITKVTTPAGSPVFAACRSPTARFESPSSLTPGPSETIPSTVRPTEATGYSIRKAVITPSRIGTRLPT